MRTLSIAGVNFLVRHPGLPAPAPAHPTYRGFADALWEGPGRRDIPVTFTRERDNPAPPSARLLLEGTDSWSLRVEGEDLVFTLAPPGSGPEPVWTARCPRNGERVTIFSSDAFQILPDGERRLVNHLQYPLDQLLLIHLLGGDGLLVHAGGAVHEGYSFLFAGPSGAGKTTLSRLLNPLAAVELLSDDRVVARRRDAGGFNLFGTPWPGEGGFAVNRCAPLAAAFLLERGPTASIRKLSRHEALKRLLPVASIPWYEPLTLGSYLTFCEELIAAVPCFSFSFHQDRQSAEALMTMFDELVAAESYP